MPTPIYDIPVHEACTAAVRQTGALLESLGHHVEEAKPQIDTEALAWAPRVIIGANLKSGLDYIGRVRGRPVTPEEVEPQTWRFAHVGGEFSAADLVSAITIVHMAGRAFGRFMTQFDAVLSPTLPLPPPSLGYLDTSLSGEVFAERLVPFIAFTSFYNNVGCPAISLPLHEHADGLPLGVMLAAGFGDEATLIRLASQIEQATPWFDQQPTLAFGE